MPTLSQHVDIHAGPEQVEAVYRDFEMYPSFISSVVSVQQEKDGMLNCRLRAAGIDIPYTARVEPVKPGEYRWTTVDGAVSHRGTVQILPHGDGTRLTLHVDYYLPDGVLGSVVGRIANWTGLLDTGVRYALECARAHIEAQ